MHISIVNDLRRQNGLKLLDIYLVDCLGSLNAKNSNPVKDKISSSNIREYLSRNVYPR